MLDNFIEIFKTGKHTDSSGNQKIWTDVDVQEFIDNHNQNQSAPIVVGHPKFNQDTYGQVDQLQFKNGVLSATFKNIDPTFEKIIQSGEIKNRSIRAKKTPKGWMLDHVGFLGASAPAISDLAPMFQAKANCLDYAFDFETQTKAQTDHQNTQSFELDASKTNVWRFKNGIEAIRSILGNVRDFLIEKHGLKTAKEVIGDFDLEQIANAKESLIEKEADYQQTNKEQKQQAQGEKSMTETTKPTFNQADIDKAKDTARQEAQAEFNQQIQTEQHKRLAIESKQAIDQLITDGNITPAQATGMSEFMGHLDESKTYSFAQNDQTLQTNPKQWFMDFVKTLKSGVETNQALEDSGETQAEFSAQQIAEYAKAHNTDPVTALENLKKENNHA